MKKQIIDFYNPSLSPKKLVLSLGGFDGIHLGHLSLIKKLLFEAKKNQIPSCLCLFDPLPFQVLKGLKSYKRLFTVKETETILRSFGLDFFCIIPFNKEFSKLNSRSFISSFILSHFEPVKIIVGYDFSFGFQREGNFSLLKEFGDKQGFEVEQVQAYLYKNKPVSSSRIRSELSQSNMEEVRSLLGRSFSIKGKVTKGEGRGRKLSVPTANLNIQQKELPPLGVYGGKVKIHNSDLKAVINIGKCPTFGSHNEISVEVHILDGDFDLYGQELEVQLDFFIRKEREFRSSIDLKEQISQDIRQALLLF